MTEPQSYPCAKKDQILAVEAFWAEVRNRERELGMEVATGYDERLIPGLNAGAIAAALAVREATLEDLDLPERDDRIRTEALRVAALLYKVGDSEPPASKPPAATVRERDTLVEAIAHLINLPPERVAEIHGVRYAKKKGGGGAG